VTGWALGPSLAVCGFGLGLAMTPFFDITLAGVTLPLVGSASGVLNANQQLGGHRRGRGAGHGVLRPVRRGPPRPGAMAAVLAASAVLVLAAGALAFRLPSARGSARRPVLASQRSHTAASPIVSTGVGRSAAQQREQEVGHGPADGDVALGVPVLPRDAPTGAADEPLPRGPEAVVGGVQVQRGAVRRAGLSAGSNGPLLHQAEPLGDAVGRAFGGNHELGPEGERGVGPVHQHLVLAPADPPGRGPRAVERPHRGVRTRLGHGVEDGLRAAVQPVDEPARRAACPSATSRGSAGRPVRTIAAPTGRPGRRAGTAA
jgi:hypothetical protein